MAKTKEPLRIEAAFQRLEEILHQLESGELTLDESLKLFEEGIALTNESKNILEAAEQTIETLVKRNTESA